MRNFRVFLMAILFIFSVPASVIAADITGNWELNYEGPMGPATWKLNLKADGTVDAEHSMFGEVKGKNDSVGDKFDVTLKVEGAISFEVHFIGTASGNTAKGTVDIMEVPTEWVAEKK